MFNKSRNYILGTLRFLDQAVQWLDTSIGREQKKQKTSLVSEIQWSNFHHDPLQWVALSLPVAPDDTISVRSWTVVTINAIQVRMVTELVPPGSVMNTGTVLGPWVIVLIFSGKWLTIVLQRVEGVTCSPWDIKLNKERSVICGSKGFIALKQAIFYKLG